MYRVAFRVDGGYKVGMGHLSECLALANEMQRNDNICILFITKKHSKVSELLRDYHIELLSEKSLRNEIIAVNKILSKFRPHVLILDITDPYPSIKRNPLFFEWIRCLREKGIFLVGIEGISTRNYYPHMIVNGTIVPEWHIYSRKPQTRYFIGPKYLILDRKFIELHREKRIISNNCNKILICMGGSDISNTTLKVINSLRSLKHNLEIALILGPWYKGESILKRKIKDYPHKIKVYRGVRDISRHMMDSDIAITSAGRILYELCATGTPSISIPIVKHQMYTAREMEKQKTTINLGFRVSQEKIKRTVEMLLNNKDLRKRMSENGKKLIDGRGVERVSRNILKHLGEKS